MKKYIALFLFAVCLITFCSCDRQNRLTLETVVELSAKGEALTWSDFERYESTDVGSGLYILVYEIDENFELRIGGSTGDTPLYMRLVTKDNKDNCIDIRTDDVEAFIEANK
ncbi:MAG: hypothetical protein IJB86_09950 [Clostridia bacterium]|nr:hypothetical protein [Clostridia bacterium]